MPQIAVSAADLRGPAGKAKLRAELIVTMLHPRDQNKRDTLANAFTLSIARTVAEAAAAGMSFAPSAVRFTNLPTIEALLDQPLTPLVRSMKGLPTDQQRRPYLPGELAGIVLQDFIVEKSERPKSAHLHKVISDLSDALASKGMKNSKADKITEAWQEYKSVSHFWAAFNQLDLQDIDLSGLLPASDVHTYALISMSELYRTQAMRIAMPRTGTLLDASAWTLPSECLDAAFWLFGSKKLPSIPV